jgi:hypothetical protein
MKKAIVKKKNQSLNAIHLRKLTNDVAQLLQVVQKLEKTLSPPFEKGQVRVNFVFPDTQPPEPAQVSA